MAKINIQPTLEEPQLLLTDSSLSDEEPTKASTLSIAQLKEKLDRWLFVLEEKDEKEERVVIGKRRSQREYDQREHDKEVRLHKEMSQNNPDRMVLSIETGLYIIPFIFRRTGFFLGVSWLVISFLLNKLSLWMHLKIYKHLIASDKTRAQERAYVYNPLLVIHKSMRSSVVMSYFLQGNYIVYSLLQIKIYYYIIFVFPFVSMQIRQSSFFKILNKYSAQDNSQLTELFNMQYIRLCCVFNFLFIFASLVLIRFRYSVLLGYCKYLLILLYVVLTSYLIAIDSQPLDLPYFQFITFMPSSLDNRYLARLGNDLLVSLFFVFKHHLKIVEQPRFLEVKEQVGVLVLSMVIGVVGVPQIDNFIRCDFMMADPSGLHICQVALSIQTVIYLLTIILLANVFCNVRNMLMYRTGIPQRTQYIFGIKKRMAINILQAVLFLGLMFSSIYSQKANTFYNYYLSMVAVLFELFLPMYILAKLSLKKQNNKIYLKILFLGVYVGVIVLVLKYLVMY